jgi:hypothetical protein
MMLALRNPLRPILHRTLNPDDDEGISAEGLGPILVAVMAAGATAYAVHHYRPEFSSKKSLAYGSIALVPAWLGAAWLWDR